MYNKKCIGHLYKFILDYSIWELQIDLTTYEPLSEITIYPNDLLVFIKRSNCRRYDIFFHIRLGLFVRLYKTYTSLIE